MTKKQKRGAKTYYYSSKDDKKSTTSFDTFDTPKINAVTAIDLVRSDIPTKHEMEVETDDLKVVLLYDVWLQIMAYTKILDIEVMGFGLVEQIENCFIVTDLYLVEQEACYSECKPSRNGQFDLMKKLIAEGKDPSKMKFWWHSHHTMGTNWSGTDRETGEKYKAKDWMVSLVSTHKGDMRARINLYTPIEMSFENCPIIIQKPLPDESKLKIWTDEILEMVKHKKTQTFTTANTPAHGNGLQGLPGKTVDAEGSSVGASLKFNTDGSNTGPFGDHFTDVQCGTRWEWNKEKKNYDVYTMFGNVRLGRTQLDKMDAIDYNTPEWGIDVPTAVVG